MTALRALAAALVVLLYARSPIDLLPDRLGGLGLLDDLVVLLLAVRWVRRQWPFAQRPGTAGAPRAAVRQAFDPHAVLGVRPGATPDEITHAYREQLKRYHPDRVAGLGEELQQVAHERTLAIQRAYAELAGRD